ATERSVFHPVERGLLGRRAVVVGVDAHLPEEHPVRPGDRLLAQVHRLAARISVAQLPQPLLDLRRRAAGAALVGDPAQPQLGELDLELSIDPAGLDHSGSISSRSSSDSGWFARNSTSFPPRSAIAVLQYATR